MFYIQSDGKLNISLRVTGRRPDGFHEIRSVFFRLSALESLTITPQYGHNVRDLLTLSGEEVKGENILEKILRSARRTSDFPPLHINLVKNVPPGSGMGAGSGNGAALLSWIHAYTGGSLPRPEEFGSDIPFVYGREKWAKVSGRGEIIIPVLNPPENPAVVVAMPRWSVSTKSAFAMLAESRGGKFPVTPGEGEAEIEGLLEVLGRKGKAGLLPNDFLPSLLKNYPEYLRFFGAFEACGASAWGLTGSGSSAFGLFYDRSGAGGLFREMAKWDSVRKIFYLE
ncbi:MAG: 4-diphosphocytidyl-2C-methyl-D-erythritol kinase [Synergistaceae bacterium]|nr:4-diphosphocytidyl-2C-methyl-D-erythritol kinase [Synergistaceae bacterium]